MLSITQFDPNKLNSLTRRHQNDARVRPVKPLTLCNVVYSLKLLTTSVRLQLELMSADLKGGEKDILMKFQKDSNCNFEEKL